MKKVYFFILIGLCSGLLSRAQQATVPEKLSKYQADRPLEKLYLSIDKPYYAAGDTLWYKAFLLDEAFEASDISDKIHIELYNDSLKLVTQRVTLLNNGLGYGDIVLDGKLPDGTYTLRAYTSWQQNFGTEHFFQTSINIGSATDKTWLVNLFQKTEQINGKSSIALAVNLKDINNTKAGFKDLEVALFSGTKKLMSNNLTTKSDGTFEIKIPVPDNPGPDYRMLIVDRKDKKRRALIPVKLSDVQVTDLQFMAEGGYLVKGLLSKVGFKAVGQDGLGKAVVGKIMNAKNEEQAVFASTHKGMGSFSFLPLKDENYYAVYKSGGEEQRIEIKNIQNEGTTLKVDGLTKKDSIIIAVRASAAKREEKDYQLIVQGGGRTVVAFKFSLKNGFFNLILPKKNFPAGIVNFTVLGPDENPLNERLLYIEEFKNITMDIKPQKNAYSLRDSVALEITAINENRQPLQGTFSLSVTHDDLVKQSKDAQNIKSYYLLSSNVQGNIEDGAWYFKNNHPETLRALDDLLLTQAWVGYKWSEVLKNENPPKFYAEKDNLIAGKVYGLLKSPSPNMNLTMMSFGKHLVVAENTTDEKGAFVFSDLPLIDSPEYVIKVKTAKGKTSNATIVVNEFQPAPPIVKSEFLAPWYFNADSLEIRSFKNAMARENELDKRRIAASGIAIKEVEIRDLNPPIIQQLAWDANFKLAINEDDLKKAPQKSLLDLLKERIPDLKISTFWVDTCGRRLRGHPFENFTIGSSLLATIRIDGIQTTLVSLGMKDTYNETGVSLTTSEKDVFTTNNYLFNYINGAELKNIALYKSCTYYHLEIISRSGKGPYLTLANGIYLHKPLPIYIGKEFYSPKYSAESKADGTDLRSTIFWDANVVTDSDGKARVSFYTGDKPGIYNIKAEGTDMQGRFGIVNSSIKVLPDNRR